MGIMMDALGQTVASAVAPFQAPPEDTPPPNPVRRVAEVAGGALGLVSLPVELMNTGFAVATNALAQALPSYPAATLGALYIGPPHPHAHPPSLVPPNPVPIPLPSLGPVTLGTSIQVLICGMPAARAGDIGLAVTCCGFTPIFEIWTGSSKVFIGGSRAARMSDFCRECQLPDPTDLMSMAFEAAGLVVQLTDAAADVIDASDARDAAAEADAKGAAADAAAQAALASAYGFAAGMKAAAAAADAATMALKLAMGKDPSLLPLPGALVVGMPNVLIGGFPMPEFPNPLMAMLGKLVKKRRRRRNKRTERTKKG